MKSIYTLLFIIWWFKGCAMCSTNVDKIRWVFLDEWLRILCLWLSLLEQNLWCLVSLSAVHFVHDTNNIELNYCTAIHIHWYENTWLYSILIISLLYQDPVYVQIHDVEWTSLLINDKWILCHVITSYLTVDHVSHSLLKCEYKPDLQAEVAYSNCLAVYYYIIPAQGYCSLWFNILYIYKNTSMCKEGTTETIGEHLLGKSNLKTGNAINHQHPVRWNCVDRIHLIKILPIQCTHTINSMGLHHTYLLGTMVKKKMIYV